MARSEPGQERMNRTRRIVRILMDAILLVVLPFGGFLCSVINHLQYAGLLALICLVLVICSESINQLTLRETRKLGTRLKADRKEFDEWTAKVRDLDAIVTKITRENDEYCHSMLDKSPRPEADTPRDQDGVPAC